jgi:pimeloyl-ACP methyl ester carboxylesterase
VATPISLNNLCSEKGNFYAERGHYLCNMKMKLGQRLVIGYYKNKLRTLSYLSKEKAAVEAFRLFCTPYTRKITQKRPTIFTKATPKLIDFEGLAIVGYGWTPTNPNGKKILILHGFSSYAYKFEHYVPLLLQMGYEVLAFDAPGHGDSEGKIVNALVYKRFICQVNEVENGIDAFIAHSFGGLALSLAMQDLPNAANKKMVLIAPATETTTALRWFYKMLQVQPDLQAAIEAYIISMAGKPISYFSVTHSLTVIDTPCLWIHDKNDLICPFSDTLQAQNNAKAQQEFFITEGLGHNKVYRDQGVMKKIGAFLTPQN